MSIESQPNERRRAPRKAASGVVELFFQPATPVQPVHIQANLVEISATGFRIAHQSPDLAPGLEFQMRYPSGETHQARVIWTHFLNGERVSGCFFLD